MGCSAVSVLELQDTETVKPGTSVVQVGMSFGPDVMRLYLDSAATLGGLFVPIADFGGRVGLSESIDIGGGIWTSTLFYAPATSFRSGDAGLRANLRWMLNERSSPERWTVGLGGWWYGAAGMTLADNSRLRASGTMFGLAPVVLYSTEIGGADSVLPGALYCGLRGMVNVGNFTYGIAGDTSGRSTGRFVGVRSGVALFAGIGRGGRGALEASALIVERLDAGLTWSLYAGFRVPLGR